MRKGCRRFEVTGFNGRTWSLNVTLPGGEVKRFTDLPTASPAWTKLTWFGFVSNATRKSLFYLDNLELVNEKK